MKNVFLSLSLVFSLFTMAQQTLSLELLVVDSNGIPQAGILVGTESYVNNQIQVQASYYTDAFGKVYHSESITSGSSGTLVAIIYDGCTPITNPPSKIIPYSFSPNAVNFVDTVIISCVPPNCNFSINAVNNSPSSNVFAFASSYNGSSSSNYLWSFGDGFTSTLPNPIHTYYQVGSYTYCLQVDSCPVICDSLLVTNVSPLQCNASFIMDTVNSQPGMVYVWNMSGVTGASPNASVNFLWSFGDGATSTQPFPTHQYQNPGTYVLCLTLTATDSTPAGGISCTSNYCDTLTVDQNGNIIYKGAIMGWSLVVLNPATIGVDEDVFSGFNLYPNPVTDYVVIDVPANATNATLEIVNLAGQQVNATMLNAGTKTEIDLNLLSAGIYFVRITANEQVKTYKLVKN